jgi:thioredoxin reductase
MKQDQHTPLVGLPRLAKSLGIQLRLAVLLQPVVCGYRSMFDVIIIGAGPAGLSAALLLGRCCRRVLVCDAETPRNGRSHALHGFLTRDGIPPLDLRTRARDELTRYGVEFRAVRADDARPDGDGFQVRLADGREERCRKLLLATGVCDELPAVAGVEACYGRSAFHCPYCDGWEVRGRRLGLYARGRSGVGMAIALRDWSPHVLLVTDGPGRLTPGERARLVRHDVRLRQERLVRLDHDAGQVRAIQLVAGEPEPCEALFFKTKQSPQSDLARRLGCRFNGKGAVKTSRLEETAVPGLYVAGDASRDVQLAIVAAAEGAKAAFAINTAFQRERLEGAGE